MSLVEGDRIWVSAGLRVCEVISVSSNYLFLPKDRFALFLLTSLVICANICALFFTSQFCCLQKEKNHLKNTERNFFVLFLKPHTRSFIAFVNRTPYPIMHNVTLTQKLINIEILKQKKPKTDLLLHLHPARMGCTVNTHTQRRIKEFRFIFY